MNYKIIVAHPGQQHSYKTATALDKNDQLFKYVTTVYNKPRSFTSCITHFLPNGIKERAVERRSSDIKDGKVKQICEIHGLILLFLQRVDKKRKIYNIWDNYITKVFGQRLAKYAIKNKVDAVIIYDTQGLYFGKTMKKKNSKIKIIMDVSAVNLEYMKTIYNNDMIICPEFKEKMLSERGYLWDEKQMDRHRGELDYPDAFLVASSFVEKSLRANNISKPIYICPYGSYFEIKNQHLDEIKKIPPLKLVYVGNTMALKGIYYLVEAVKGFKIKDVLLTVVGDCDLQYNYFKDSVQRINYVGNVPHNKVRKYLEQADVFVMPSLGDGFSLATLEALSVGLPCIVSDNTGIAEHIIDYENGIVFKTQNVDSLRNAIQWFLDNMGKIPYMKKKALETANKLSWNNYYATVQKAIEKIMEDSK